MSKSASGKKCTDKAVASNPSIISEPKVDAVLTSKSREALKVMAENPSINMEAVDRINKRSKTVNTQ